MKLGPVAFRNKPGLKWLETENIPKKMFK